VARSLLAKSRHTQLVEASVSLEFSEPVGIISGSLVPRITAGKETVSMRVMTLRAGHGLHLLVKHDPACLMSEFFIGRGVAVRIVR
jgi:hypothetical protein